MRDDYVKLIKEYLNLKPEYKHTLNEIRANVMLVGATEEEFNKAIQEITGIPNAVALLENNNSKTIPQSTKTVDPKLYLAFRNVIKNKKIAASLVSILIILTAGLYLKFGDQSITKKTVNTVAQVIKPVDKKAKSEIPQVYANSQSIDGKQVFSYPAKTNVKLAITSKPTKEIVGFLPYWMLDVANQIDLDELTQVNLFSITVDGKGNIVNTGSDGNPDGGWVMWNDSSLDTFIHKAKSKNVKVLLTFNSFNNSDIESIALSDSAQKRFIDNAIYMVNSKNLDGVNIDFEYTGTPDTKVREGFTRFIANLNAELQRQFPGALLSVDTYITSGADPGLFDIESLTDSTSSLIVMGYDIHTPLGDPGPISPMQGDTNIIGLMQSYLEKVPANKLILAVPYYGYDWVTQANSSNGTIDTSQNTVLPYAQVLIQSAKYKISWDTVSETPSYQYVDSNGLNHEVHFEDVRSLGIKYDYINEKGLQGLGIWALGYDGQNTDLEQLIYDKFLNNSN